MLRWHLTERLCFPDQIPMIDLDGRFPNERLANAQNFKLKLLQAVESIKCTACSAQTNGSFGDTCVS